MVQDASLSPIVIEKITKTCEMCGENYTPGKQNGKALDKSRFCSTRCRAEHFNVEHPRVPRKEYERFVKWLRSNNNNVTA